MLRPYNSRMLHPYNWRMPRPYDGRRSAQSQQAPQDADFHAVILTHGSMAALRM